MQSRLRFWWLPFAVAALQAQELRPSISGLVTDPSGGPVRGARIEASHALTGAKTAATSNDAGHYTLQFLSPGEYSVAVEATGFKRSLVSVVLETSVRLGLDLRLEIGPLTETVTVTGTAGPLETSDASRGTTISRQQVIDLPNNGRNIYQLAFGAAGVTKTSTYWGSIENYATGNATNVQINGGVRRENETLLDGVTNTQPTRDVAFQPPIEAVEEARVQTSTFDSSYGRFGGGVLAITTKSGTNAFHGTLYETNKSGALAANAWVLNSLSQGKQRFVNNTFGFQAGGPVIRERLFFMAAYEGLEERSSGSDSSIVPTTQQRAGDFSGFSRVLYDPLTTRQEGSRFVRDAFAGNRIPLTRLDPVAIQTLEFVPHPNLPGRVFPLQNYASTASASNSYKELLSKVDFNINSANRIYFSYGRLPYTEFSGPLFSRSSPAEPGNSNPLKRDFYRWVGDWSSTLSPTTVFNLRAGLARFVNTRGNPPAAGFDPRSLGFSNALVSQMGFLQFPAFVIGGGYSAIGTTQVFLRDAKDSWSYQANLSHTLARHQVRLGSEFRIYNENARTPGRASGLYNFNKGFTQADPARADAASGDEMASFLLGYPASAVIDRNIDPAFQGRYFALFLQDDWKLSSRLTLNLGVRWDYERPYAERYNRMLRGFDFNAASPISRPAFPLNGGLLFSNAENRLAFEPDRNNFQPRIGAAYQLANNWVIRGGYGLYYLGVNGGQPTTGFSQATAAVTSQDAGNTPRVTLANAFPEGLLRPVGSSAGLASQLGQAVAFGYRNRVIPYAHQYSAGLQHSLPGGLVVEASYSGNSTRRYPVSAPVNVIPAGELGKPDSYYRELVPNPMAGLIPLNAAKNGASIARQDLLLPFPQYGAMTMNNVPIGRSGYHSLQLRVQKRYSAGLAVSASYTISKTLEQMSFLNAQDFNLADIDGSRLEKRLAQFDVPQKFALLASYALPFGRGKLRGGWQLNGQLTLQSGFPIDFPNAPNILPRSAKLDSPQVDVYHAFDISNFPRTAPNLQYALRAFPTRFPDVRLMPLKNLDVSIAKKTRIGEGYGFEIRAEFLNAANHPWFSRINDRGTDVTRPEFGWFYLEEQNQNRLIALVGKFTF